METLNERLSRERGRPFMHTIMSVGRLGFMENMFCAIQNLLPLGITITKSQGAFWGQCMTRAALAALETDRFEWLMFMDYDTVFTVDDVEAMIDIALRHPEIDALAPLQMHRLENRPLISIKGDDGKPLSRIPVETLFQSEAMPISTAHMGAVIFKVDKLLAMPKPWFHSTPDPAGGWDEGRVDEDTWFWREWEKAGNSLYLANHIAVGHCELMVRWPDTRWNTIHQHPHTFWKEGKPKEVWK